MASKLARSSEHGVKTQNSEKSPTKSWKNIKQQSSTTSYEPASSSYSQDEEGDGPSEIDTMLPEVPEQKETSFSNTASSESNGSAITKRDAFRSSYSKHNKQLVPDIIVTEPNTETIKNKVRRKSSFFVRLFDDDEVLIEDELYKKNLCSVLTGVLLFTCALTIVCLSLVIYTNLPNPSSTSLGAFDRNKDIQDVLATLNKRYIEIHSGYWAINPDDQPKIGAAVFYHLVSLHSMSWRKTKDHETWMWSQGQSVTIHMVSASSGSNHTSVILGDILKLHSDVQTTVVIQPNTWVTGVLRPGNAPYTLLNIITKPDFYRNHTTEEETEMLRIYPDIANLTQTNV